MQLENVQFVQLVSPVADETYTLAGKLSVIFSFYVSLISVLGYKVLITSLLNELGQTEKIISQLPHGGHLYCSESNCGELQF